MDFLDPKKKRARSIQLTIGHTLMALLVIIGTYLLVSQAYGFDVDKRTGTVIRNGLIFIDSAPSDAQIKLNNVVQRNRTNSRLALPEGNYSLNIQKDGYREWNRDFEMKGGYVEHFTYPMLIPNTLDTVKLQTLTALPTTGLQSPDRRWVLLSTPVLGTFTQYDLNTLRDKKPVSSSVAFPATLFHAAAGAHQIELVEWSTDNKNVLVKHSFTNGYEFLVLNRDEPNKSININQQLKQNPVNVALWDKKPDQLYLYQSGGVLQTASLKDSTVTPFLTGVLAFKSHGDDVMLYAQTTPNEPSKVRVSLKEGSKTYVLRDMPAATNIPLEIARFDSKWYVVVGSDAEQKTYVYENPQDYINKNQDKRPSPVAVLKSTGPIREVKFSQNTRFIMANNGQHFAVYDVETDRSYAYDIKEAFDQSVKPVWMDGHRIIVNTGTQPMMFDYDGTNIQKLTSAEKTLPIFFNRDYTFVYTVAPQASGFDVNQVALRTPADQ